MRRFVPATTAATAAAMAWLSLGAVGIAPGAATHTRIGVLPPWWLLVVLALLFGGLIFVGRWSVRRCLPLYGTAVCVLPWLPWRPPAALLAWQGVLAGVVWAGVATAILASAPVAWPRWAGAQVTSPRRAPWWAGVLAATLFAVAWLGPRAWLPGGDEPHYLVITQSLLRDHDLQIENNHARHDYLAYYPGELRPDYLRRGVDRQIYSIHAPGLPMLVLPAFALGGYVGVVVFLILLNAVGAALAWYVAWRVCDDVGAAWAGWAAIVTSLAFVTHAYMVFPDAPSSGLALVGVWALVSAGDTAPRRLALVGLALALLPWLHTRNVLLATALGVTLVLRLWRRADRWAALTAFATPAALSAVGWFAYFKVIYGSIDPSSPYGAYSQTAWQHIGPGLSGLLVDQQYGLLTNGPAVALAAVGLASALVGRAAEPARSSGRRRLAIELVVLVVPYVLAASAYRMWWGGASGVARFLVPALLPMVVPAALGWQALRTYAGKALGVGLLLGNASMLVCRTWPNEGLFAVVARSRFAPMEEWASRAVDLSTALPSLMREPQALAAWVTITWLGGAVLFWMALRVVGTTRGRAAALAVPTAVVVASACMTAAWSIAGVTPYRVDASRLGLLGRASMDGVGVVLGKKIRGMGRLASVADVLPLAGLATTSRDPLPGDLRAVVGPLPAGRYRVQVATEDENGDLVVSVGRTGYVERRALEALDTFASGQRGLAINLPVPVDSLVVRSTAKVDVSVAAESLLSRSQRASSDTAFEAHRYGPRTVFLPTGDQFPERDGIWLKGSGAVPLVVQADQPFTALRLFVRNGPLDNEVAASCGRWSETRALAPSQELEIPIPFDAPRTTALVRVRSARWFRPSEVDPASGDPRRLGLWVEFR